ncbi:uncharacterized protein LOC128391708 [Panonychus citri]|uniref:uncharacterized protein LOC128391708 n=1 Tax=Panonychus citri TaxID=50023 RepID=UPI002306F0FE|nr:uncharacterized protein LOC128391708 [Panonychus citri]
MKMNLSSLINLLFLCSCLIIFLLITYCVPNVQGLSQSSLSSFSSFSSSPSPSSFPIFPSSSSSSSSSISNHVHEIATFGDQIASLPCEVNIKSCGSISMVTWFKNVSSQWEHIYSYSFTGGGHHKVSGSFIGQPERISMDDTNITLTGITYLRIKNLGLSDEANYKCEVTYHHSTSTINHHHNNNNMINNNHDNINGKLLSSSSMPSTDCPTTTYSKLFTLVESMKTVQYSVQ